MRLLTDDVVVGGGVGVGVEARVGVVAGAVVLVPPVGRAGSVPGFDNFASRWRGGGATIVAPICHDVLWSWAGDCIIGEPQF